MTIFSDVESKTIDEQYIQALKDDNIDVQEDVIRNAMKGDAQAIYTIGCIYAAMKNKEKAILWLGTSSAMGLHQSQIEIGKMFENLGSGHYNPAIEWYKQAGNHGVLSGYAHIGDVCLKKGIILEAEEQYKISADRGDPYGQLRLGLFYQQSYIHRVNFNNYALAKECFTRSAEQNYPQGQYELANLYRNGTGTEVDKYQALIWYQKSKAGGYGPADSCIKALNNEGYFYIPKFD